MYRVLIVEDQETLAKNLALGLHRIGLHAEYALDGKTALKACRDCQFDALCIDIQLPDCNGLDLLEKLRPQRPNLAAIVISSEGSGDNERRAERLGAMAFLTKPLQLTTLRRLLNGSRRTTIGQYGNG